MRRTITLKEIIDILQRYPSDATVTIDTQTEVQIVGFVVQRKDGNKQIAEIALPRKNTGQQSMKPAKNN